MNWGAAVLILAGIGIVAVGVTGSQKTICQAISGSDCTWIPNTTQSTSGSPGPSGPGDNPNGLENATGISIDKIISGCSSNANCKQYSALAITDANNWGIDSHDFVRQIAAESAFNPKAKSSAGAEGIAQFMPSTAQSLGVDPFNPTASLNAAAKLMSQYENYWNEALDQSTYGFSGGISEAQALSLSSYNMGGAGTISIVQKYKQDWINHVPSETYNYIMGIEYPQIPVATVTGKGGGG